MNSVSLTTSRRLVYNTVFNVAAKLIFAGISFFMLPFLTKCLGMEVYGIWLLVGSVFTYRNMLSAGFTTGVSYYIPRCLARNDVDGIQRVLSTTWLFLCVPGVILAVFTVVAYYYLTSWFIIDPLYASSARLLVLMVGFVFAIGTPLEVFGGVLMGLQRHDLLNIALLVPNVVRVVLLVFLLTRGYGLVTVGVMSAGCELVIRVIQGVFCYRILPVGIVTLRGASFSQFREMFAYGANTFLFLLGGMIFSQASMIIIGVTISTAAVTEYRIAIGIPLILAELIGAFSMAIKPAATDLHARGDGTRLKEVACAGQKYSLILLIPSTVFFIVMGRDFLYVYGGEQFVVASTAMAILAVGYFSRLSQYSNFLVLVGMGMHRVFGALTLLSALLCVLLAIISVKWLHWGLIGIALANTIPLVIANSLYIPYYASSRIGIPIRQSLRVVWWPAIVGCFPATVMLVLWKFLAAPKGWGGIGLVIVSAALLTAVSVWRFSLSEAERRKLLNAIKLKRLAKAH